MSETCSRCGAEGSCDGLHLNWGYMRNTEVFECPCCGSQWATAPGRLERLKSTEDWPEGRYVRFDDGGHPGWCPEGALAVLSDIPGV